MIRRELEILIKDAVCDVAGVCPKDIDLTHPSSRDHGDYSSNIAMTMFRDLKKQKAKSKITSPFELANDINKAIQLKISSLKNIEKTEVVKPGFINIHLSTEFLAEELNRVIKEKERYGQSETNKDKKVMVEFTDPNPFKEFHIGHLFSNVVGESISRLLESSGALVRRVNYQGDVGMHVAKALWGLLQQVKSSKFKVQNLEKKSLEERMKFLGECYAEGAKAFEEDENARKEIAKLNEKIYRLDPEVKEVYEKGRKWSLDYFEKIYKRLGTKFDHYYFEREVGDVGAKLVKEFVKKGVFKKSKGAIIFLGEKHGLHNRVFINSQGFPTYEAKELGLAPTKYKDFKYDESIIVTGNEINAYFQVLIAALSQVNPDLGKKTKHISHGMVRLSKGKLSSRTGEVLTGEWLLNEAKSRIGKVRSKKAKVGEKILDQIAIGAVKYALLRHSVGRDIAFDLDKSVSFEGNSGPYLQYTFARCRSVLRRARMSNVKAQMSNVNEEELTLLRTLYIYPEVVEEAVIEYAPHKICSFLFDLAQKFNIFYEKHPIINAKDPSIRDFRLALTAGTAQVIKNGLGLLGIEAPEKM